MEKSEYLQPVTQAIDANREELVDISLDIHSHPELNFQEHHAAK
ncbi:MAG TPA: amidohydrolase, partial [Dehalococcoidia bacterium]|nr:amidohydrolase [Dehalococcoidia bacterium]